MNPLIAARAYSTVQGTAMPTAPVAPKVNETAVGAPDFSALLKNVMNDTAQQTRAAESQMSQAVQGQGSLIDVVTAISSAEASLQTVIAVRDQVISAYQEIMRMPI